MARTMLMVFSVLAAGLVCRAEEKEGIPVSGSLVLDIGPEASAEEEPGKAGDRRRKPRCLKKEPTAIQVIRAAWMEAGLMPDQDRSRMKRLRGSAWLPRVTGGVSKDIAGRWDVRYETGSSPVDQLHHSDGWRWDVGLTWDLSSLVYQSDELQVTREASRRLRERLELTAMVSQVYHQRLRLLVRGLPRPGSGQAIELLEATAILDAWTGERFKTRWCEVKP
jgi:hypothetical protein